MHTQIKKDLQALANTEKAKLYLRFFKTGKGEYGEGDKFLGITVPEQRKVAKKFKDATLKDIQALLDSPFHEHRFTALVLLVQNKLPKKAEFYLANTHNINNWDLVDVSAHKILGPYLENKSHDLLTKLAKSKSLWERRIAIITTAHFINQNNFTPTLKIATILLQDPHDLIHKAVGWMLREIGNRDRKTEEDFLKPIYKTLPRTMLRYAIEKFPEPLRQKYLKGKI